MRKAEREYIGLLAKRAYDLEVKLGMAVHYVGNIEGGDTDALNDCCEELASLRAALEEQASD
jgi:hypothetical protein